MADALRVIIVDDTQLLRMSLRQALAAAGLLVVADYTSGEELLEHLGSHDVDALLVDLRMPGIGGLETIQLVADQYPQLRIVMMSAYGDQTLMEQALQAGAAAYIIKGAPLAQIVDALRG